MFSSGNVLSAPRLTLGLRGKSFSALALGFLMALLIGTLIARQGIDRLRNHFGSQLAENLTLLQRERIVGPVGRELVLARRLARSQLTRDWLLDENNPTKRQRFFREAEEFRTDMADHSYFIAHRNSGHYYFNDQKLAYSETPRFTLSTSREADAWFYALMQTTGIEQAVNVDVNHEMNNAKVWFNALVFDGAKLIGAAGSGLDLAEFMTQFGRTDLAGVTPMILDRQATILIHPDRRLTRANAETNVIEQRVTLFRLLTASDAGALQAALREAEKSTGAAIKTELFLNGTRQKLAISYIPDLRWHVVNAVDPSAAALLSPQWLVVIGIAVIGAMLLLFIAFSLAIERLILRRLRRLKESASAIAEGNYALALPPPNDDEIGALSNAFALMAEQVRRNAEELESKVAARTNELQQTLERLKGTQDELVRAETLASLGAMVAGISHELNTPIGNALTVASTLQDKVAEITSAIHEGKLRRSSFDEFVEHAQEMSALIVRTTTRAAELIASFKQVALDQTSERRRVFELRSLCEDVLSTLRSTLGHDFCEIANQVPEGIICDTFPGPLSQILTNLVQNADRHGFTGRTQGRIVISAETSAQDVTLTVTDDGNGMAPTLLAHIFEPFFTTRLGQGGSGLGLAICHRFATSILGGDIGAVSVPGKGSCFTLHFKKMAPGQMI